MCELCDSLGNGLSSKYDTYLCMWLCDECFNSFNGVTEAFELDEVYDY